MKLAIHNCKQRFLLGQAVVLLGIHAAVFGPVMICDLIDKSSPPLSAGQFRLYLPLKLFNRLQFNFNARGQDQDGDLSFPHQGQNHHHDDDVRNLVNRTQPNAKDVGNSVTSVSN